MNMISFSLAFEQHDITHTLFNRANAIFNQARWQADIGWLLAFITGRRSMPTLAGRLAGKGVRGQHTRGTCSIEIRRIVGTEWRAEDFDPNFNPLDDRMRYRWVSIAAVKLSENELPAVDLIQAGDEYYVRDGHHRVSVARALGIQFIDAHVTVLEV